MFLTCWPCERSDAFPLPHHGWAPHAKSLYLLRVAQGYRISTQQDHLPKLCFLFSPDESRDSFSRTRSWPENILFDLLHTQSVWLPPGEVGWCDSWLPSGVKILFPSQSCFPSSLSACTFLPPPPPSSRPVSHACPVRWESICLQLHSVNHNLTLIEFTEHVWEEGKLDKSERQIVTGCSGSQIGSEWNLIDCGDSANHPASLCSDFPVCEVGRVTSCSCCCHGN